ncbi:hypothetical protein QJS10_CPA05g01045 [Acorus calamus]|uniref:Uncharacterized protein n=1 Tax=Acorus calamus TaxID=4465 RepID=A0AAV9EX76_ACOCL|nr:hypothetical protein QJS10_CPA05g01045 [Acorus calamus]
MAGVAILLDLLKKNQQGFSTETLHSFKLLSASVAASAAAASVAAGRPFPSRYLFGGGGISVAACDAGVALNGDYVSSIHGPSEGIYNDSSVQLYTKEYTLELKPLFSAFRLRALLVTSLKSFLMYYLPLLEPRAPRIEDEDDDLLEDPPAEQPLDLVVPFKQSVKQIIRETTVVTTRRVLERLAVCYVSQRIAWKLLKDASKSAQRKARRGMPSHIFFYSVCKTTFRGYLLGVVASWLVKIGIETYRCWTYGDDEDEEVDNTERLQLFLKRIRGATVRCCSSLAFASIGAGIGAFFSPSRGQWIGCALGDAAGPYIIAFCFKKIHLTEP